MLIFMKGANNYWEHFIKYYTIICTDTGNTTDIVLTIWYMSSGAVLLAHTLALSFTGKICFILHKLHCISFCTKTVGSVCSPLCLVCFTIHCLHRFVCRHLHCFLHPSVCLFAFLFFSLHNKRVGPSFRAVD